MAGGATRMPPPKNAEFAITTAYPSNSCPPPPATSTVNVAGCHLASALSAATGYTSEPPSHRVLLAIWPARAGIPA